MLHEAIVLTNYGTEPATVPLSISFAADFRDMFEVRGLTRDKQRPMSQPPRVENGEVRARAISVSMTSSATRRSQFSPEPD